MPEIRWAVRTVEGDRGAPRGLLSSRTVTPVRGHTAQAGGGLQTARTWKERLGGHTGGSVVGAGAEDAALKRRDLTKPSRHPCGHALYGASCRLCWQDTQASDAASGQEEDPQARAPAGHTPMRVLPRRGDVRGNGRPP